MIAVAFAIAALTAPGTAVAQEAASCSPSGVTVSAAAVKACVATVGIDGDHVTVTDPIDLTDLATVEHSIRCHDCRLMGGLRIADVTFTRVIDFDNVLIDGDIDARGATFEGPVLARGDRSATSTVTGAADFSLATFQDAATFDAITFSGVARFDGARFDSSLSFEGTQFGGDASFERIEVDGFFVLAGPVATGSAKVPSGAVAGHTVMTDALFHGPADLSARSFLGGLDGRGATFLARASLAKATVGPAGTEPGLDLDGASFTELDASGATFLARASVQLARATSLNLNQATALAGLTLQGTEVVGSASFDGTQLQGQLILDKFSAAEMVLDIDALSLVESQSSRRAILGTIERTARATGEIPLANSARFRLLQIDGARSAFPARELDWVFYEQLAGYLVRPLRPLRALFILIALGTAARYVVDAWRRKRSIDGGVDGNDGKAITVTPGGTVALMSRRVRLGHEVTGFLQRFARATIASIRPKPSIASPVGETTVGPFIVAGLALGEYVVSKILLFVFLLSLANYNATLRELLSAVNL